MRWPWRDFHIPSTDVSAEFHHALMRQILKTEVVRVTAVIVFSQHWH